MTACYKADDTHMCVPLLFELPYFVLESVYGVVCAIGIFPN